jgi:hypothetical protein
MSSRLDMGISSSIRSEYQSTWEKLNTVSEEHKSMIWAKKLELIIRRLEYKPAALGLKRVGRHEGGPASNQPRLAAPVRDRTRIVAKAEHNRNGGK